MFQQRETSKKSSFWSFFCSPNSATLPLLSSFIHRKLIAHWTNLHSAQLWVALISLIIIDYYPCCNKYHNWSDKLGRSTKLWRFRAYSNPLLFPSFSSSHLFDPDVADVRLRSSTLFASNATSLSTLSIWNCITLMPLDRQQRYFYPVFFQSRFKFLRYSD